LDEFQASLNLGPCSAGFDENVALAHFHQRDSAGRRAPILQIAYGIGGDEVPLLLMMKPVRGAARLGTMCVLK